MRIILVGKAGSGKDYFRDWLYHTETLDVSYTTRPSREGEIKGYTYNYINRVDFERLALNDFFLELVKFNGWYYGTSLDNWKEKTVFIMTPTGTNCIPDEDRSDCVFVYFDIPVEVRKKRLAQRSDADTVDRRIAADEKDFKGFNSFNIRVTNPMFDVESLYTTILAFNKANK
tara:strand:- start:37 stop:555 length:519 start_codon:yes stop_codon:yes gene_type:complete